MINDIFSSFFRTIGRILAYLLLGALVGYLFMISGCEPVKAHVVVETYSPDYVFNPQLDSSIVNANANWGSGYIPTSINNSSPWLTNVGQFEYKSNLNGIYLNIEADFYLGIAFNTNDSAVLNNWLADTRNTLTANNLRCGIGSAFKSGYDSSYAPIVSNFSVTLYEGKNSTGNYLHYVYHIKYQYNQQIAKVTNLNSNVSCWFERNPDNGLFAQIVNFAGITEFFYYNKTFNFNVSTDPNTAILDGIQSGINDTNDKIDETNDLISSDEIDTSSSDSFFNNFSTEDNGGISSIVTAPLKMIRSITETCSPLNIPFYDNDIELPCGDTLFWNRADVQTFRNTWNIIIGAPIIYMLLVKLFQVIQNIKNPGSSKVEVMKL